ncbi:hypothetical protein PFISCL1PPCAC_1107, partial [Pristionchus fissidentatus]
RFADDFKPIKVIGVGGFGCVFEAENKLEEFRYAVKRIALKENSSDKEVRDALKEVRAMARFDHSNIVRYYGSWIERPPPGWQSYCNDKKRNIHEMNYWFHDISQPCLLLERYIDLFQLCRSSLADWLKKNPQSRDPAQMRSWFTQVVEAIAYIHEKNFIHRDLKAS